MMLIRCLLLVRRIHALEIVRKRVRRSDTWVDDYSEDHCIQIEIADWEIRRIVHCASPASPPAATTPTRAAGGTTPRIRCSHSKKSWLNQEIDWNPWKKNTLDRPAKVNGATMITAGIWYSPFCTPANGDKTIRGDWQSRKKKKKKKGKYKFHASSCPQYLNTIHCIPRVPRGAQEHHTISSWCGIRIGT